MTSELRGNWTFPTKVIFGAGRVRDLPKTLGGAGVSRPLVVTDAGIRGLPMIAALEEMLGEADLAATLFSDVKGNPIGANVTDGVAAFRAGGCDGAVAIGGGSALDAGKAIALMAGQDRPLWDFEEKPGNWRRANPDGIVPVVAIPTTAGTGSEVGRSSVIVNEESESKVIIFHPRMLPVTVISDPELTVGLPPHITAATGMDALVHCFEAYCAPGFHPMAEGIALNGMALIKDALPAAYRIGGDIDARSKLLAAASMGAVAFQKGLGGVHAIAHPVGALYDTHHGLTNAVILPYVMRHNADAIADKVPLLCRVLDLPGAGFQDLLDWVETFRADLGIPETLRQIGVDDERAEEVSVMAAADNCALGNPVPVDAAALKKIFLQALDG